MKFKRGIWCIEKIDESRILIGMSKGCLSVVDMATKSIVSEFQLPNKNNAEIVDMCKCGDYFAFGTYEGLHIVKYD